MDLITFYSPAFWGKPDSASLTQAAAADPEWFWGRLFDAAVQAGLSSLEITFPPGDWRNALAAFGSAKGFRDELASRGLDVVSGFYSGFVTGGDVLSADRAKLIEEALQYAAFVRETGSGLLVAGLPMRKTRDAQPAHFVNADYAQRLSDVINEVGAAMLREGVRLALHTEAHSVFWTRRDVDLFMLYTDPLYVWFCPDTGHLALSGTDPVAAASYHRDRVAIAHWKDATGPAPMDVSIDHNIHNDHRRYFRRVGAGSIDWFSWARLVREMRMHPVTLLEIDAVDDPVAEIIAARQFITSALAPIYAPGT